MKSMGVGRTRSLLVLPALVLLIVLAAYLHLPRTHTVRFQPAEHAVSNPLMGLAADARTDPQRVPGDVTLVRALVTWRELEPAEGEYAFDAFDEAIHLDRWRERGAKLILRLSLDSAFSGHASDLPDWLRLRVGGTHYLCAGETRFSPDYADPELQERHLMLLQAIARRYGDDIAYVEMGSLGSGGAWRSEEEAPKLPMTDVTGVYIWQYLMAFPGHTVLAAGPYHEAMLGGAGAYADDLSRSEETWEWISRFRYGGWDDQIDSYLRAQPTFGLDAPVGAGLHELPADAYALVRLIRESRATYLCCTEELFAAPELAEAAQRELGYRFWIRQAVWPQRVRPDYSLYVDISVENDAAAPAPVEMPLCLALLDAQGNVVCTERTDADASHWLPGESALRVRLTVPYDLERGEYTLAAAVCDADTLEPAVRFAMDCDLSGLWHLLGPVRVY